MRSAACSAQRRQADRQRQHQGAERQRGDQGQRCLYVTAEIRGGLAYRAQSGGQVTLGDTSLSVAGARVNVPAQVKPLIDKTVADQINAVSERLRNDPDLARNARVQWAKACRSIPLQGTTAVAAAAVAGTAADPRARRAAACRCLGRDADARHRGRDPHHAEADQPDCPFPTRSRSSRRRRPGVASACRSTCPLPISTRSWKRNSPGAPSPRMAPARSMSRSTRDGLGIRRPAADLAAGPRQGKEKLFGFGGEATVHVWGRPVLDQAQQTLRLTDVQFAVESEAASDCSALPHARPCRICNRCWRTSRDRSQAIRGQRAKKIADAISDFQKNEDGVRVGPTSTPTARLHRLRFEDAAGDRGGRGSVNVAVTKLPAF